MIQIGTYYILLTQTVIILRQYSKFSKYSLEDFNKSTIDRTKSLNILHNNSRSILKEGRIDEYNILFDYLLNAFHILAFTETWLKPNNVDLVRYEGYDIIRPIDKHFDFTATWWWNIYVY